MFLPPKLLSEFRQGLLLTAVRQGLWLWQKSDRPSSDPPVRPRHYQADEYGYISYVSFLYENERLPELYEITFLSWKHP